MYQSGCDVLEEMAGLYGPNSQIGLIWAIAPKTDHGDREHDPVGDPQARSGQQVVGKRIAREALERGQREQHGADQPVDLPRLAKRAGEEDPQRVQADGGHEKQRCPVVDLPDEQPAAHVEADAERGGVRLGHLDAVQVDVAAVVDDLGHARLEEQGQERPGEQQDDEGVQRDLAEEERPVIGEGLLERALGEIGRAEAIVDVSGHAPQAPFHAHR
jgi:hypothetical protein